MLEQLGCARDRLLAQSYRLHPTVGAGLQWQFATWRVTEQLKAAAACNLKEAQMSEHLPGRRAAQQHLARVLLDAAHCVRLPAPCLAIHEERRAATREHIGEERVHTPFAQLGRLDVLIEGLRDHVLHVAQEHALQVGLHAAVVHHDAPWRAHAHDVELTPTLLVRKQRPLAHERAQPTRHPGGR